MLSELLSMALSIEEDTVLVSMLPLRALVPMLGLNGQGEELVRAWLGCSSYGLPFSVLFGACLGWNVTFVRKGVSDELSWVSPDELSGLT